MILKVLDKIPLLPLVLLSLTLGLAPSLPEPHLIEKLRMLASGSLSNITDMLDLLMHAAAPCLLILKLMRMRLRRPSIDTD